MSQNATVALIVLSAALWAVWYWMPGRWRKALAAWMAHGARRMGLRERGAQRIATALGDAPGCGSCESCGSCATPGAAHKTPQGSVAQAEPKPVTVVRRA